MKCPFCILLGLPLTPSPIAFSPNGGHAFGEGIIVRFEPEDATEWVGAFEGGVTNFNAVIAFPDNLHLFVISNGMGYVVDPFQRKVIQEWGCDITYAEVLTKHDAIILGNNIEFDALRIDSLWWSSPRISWDGFRNVRIEGEVLLGEAYSPLDDSWHLFNLSALSGVPDKSIYLDQIAQFRPIEK